MGISPDYGYFRLGTEQSGNLHLWRDAVVMQTARLRQVQAEGREGKQFDFDAHFLFVAIRNGLRFAERVQDVVKDERLGKELAAFVREFPAANDLRDVFTHLDEYVLDQGHLQPAGRSKRKGEVALGSSSWRVDAEDDAVVAFGPFAIKLFAVAAEARKVLDLAAEVWLRGLREDVDGLGAEDA